MKNTLILLVTCLLTLNVQAQNTLKIMSYNIKNAVGMDNVCSYQRIANIITNQAPDVAILEEVDSMTARSGHKYVLGEIADRTQMHAYFAPAIRYDGGKYGIGLLSRRQPLSVRHLPLPGREEARVLLVAEFADYIFCGTHLSLTEEDRMASLKLIREMALQAHKPLFLAGDMNALPQSDFIQELQKDFELLTLPSEPTYPAPLPEETIDYVAVYKPTCKGLTLISSHVLDEPVASDHRPISVQLRMAQKTERMFRNRPYLQNPTGNGITIMWETTAPTRGWVEYGTDSTRLTRARLLIDGQETFDNTLHKIRLNGLRPGQRYYYRVCSQEILEYQAYHKVLADTARSTFSSFVLPTADTDAFTAFVFNDIHQYADTYHSLCRQLKGLHPNFVVFNGDCVDDPASYDQASDIIGILTEGVGGDTIPTFFLRGNHEIRNVYSIGLRNHYDYVNGKTYGAFNWGDTRIVMLDCGEDKPDTHWVYYGLNDFTQLRHDQAKFMKQEFSSRAFKKAAKRILIHHIPLYGNESEGKNLCADFWTPILKKAPFDVSLNAHTHHFAYHAIGTKGNAYPVIIGGGYTMDSATVTVLQKTGKKLRVYVINTQGDKLLDLTI